MLLHSPTTPVVTRESLEQHSIWVALGAASPLPQFNHSPYHKSGLQTHPNHYTPLDSFKIHTTYWKFSTSFVGEQFTHDCMPFLSFALIPQPCMKAHDACVLPYELTALFPAGFLRLRNTFLRHLRDAFASNSSCFSFGQVYRMRRIGRKLFQSDIRMQTFNSQRQRTHL